MFSCTSWLFACPLWKNVFFFVEVLGGKLRVIILGAGMTDSFFKLFFSQLQLIVSLILVPGVPHRGQSCGFPTP